jgi:DNA polymerase-3 subunit beta
MHATIDREQLRAALGFVAKVVPTRSTIPILETVHLEAIDSGLKLSATNMVQWAHDTADGYVHTPAEGTPQISQVCVPAHRLREIADRAPDGCEIELRLVKEHSMRVTAGRGRFTLACLPADHFPGAPALEAAAHSIAPAALTEALKATAPAAGREETRIYLCGVCLSERPDGALEAVATDGNRLHLHHLDGQHVSQWQPAIVPRDALALIERLCEGADSLVALACDDNRLEVSTGTRRLMTQLIDGTYPEFRRVIPEGGDGLVVRRVDLLGAVQRVIPFGEGDKSRGVHLKTATDGLRLAAADTQGNSGCETIDTVSGAAVIDLGINGAYLVDALRALSCSDVRLVHREASGPLRLDPVTDSPGEQIRVIMPLRLNRPVADQAGEAAELESAEP